MAHLNRHTIIKLQDAMAHDEMTLKYLKYFLMSKYRYSARKAKVLAAKITHDGCEYWYMDEAYYGDIE